MPAVSAVDVLYALDEGVSEVRQVMALLRAAGHDTRGAADRRR